MTNATLTSHMMPTNTALYNKNLAELMIVSPPRSGSAFLLKNLRNALVKVGATDPASIVGNGDSRILATCYLSELDSSVNTISIVRKPSDWILSLVSLRLFLESRTDVSAVLDEEIAAAETALQSYLDVDGDNVVFIKFEDVTFRFYKVARKVADIFGCETVEDHEEKFGPVVLAADTPMSPTTSTRLATYAAVASALATKNLSVVNGLYQSLLNKTITV